MLVNEFNANQTRQLGFDKQTPLALASINDKFDCVEFLCDHKGRVNCKDKFERTPLILAIKNGHSKIASLLLQRGASWEQADSSMNTPIHYAAGFGWIDCLELLIKVGANINS
jgi:ankyrin repeat protein